MNQMNVIGVFCSDIHLKTLIKFAAPRNRELWRLTTQFNSHSLTLFRPGFDGLLGPGGRTMLKFFRLNVTLTRIQTLVKRCHGNATCRKGKSGFQIHFRQCHEVWWVLVKGTR